MQRRSLVFPLCVTLLAALIGSASPLPAAENLLVRAKIKGKESSLYEKIVVISGKATLSAAPGKQGEPIEPFAVFFRLKNEDIPGSNGYVRVGTSSGEPLGWIKQADVASWNTRFILEPLQPVPGRTFSVALDAGTRADLDTVPEGKRRFALVMDAPDSNDAPFPVVVYAGNVQTEGAGGTLARERNQLRDLKLEVVFVLETTDFLLNTFDDVNVGDSVKGVIRQAGDLIRQNKELQGAVRLGLVEYQDTTSKANFVSRVACELTDKPSMFDAKIELISPISIQGDWPEDVIAGLDTAVRTAGWSENSSKHIILLGASSCQLYPKGQAVSQFGGDWNFITRKRDDYGWSTTALSIRQLIARANPQAGSTAERARRSMTFHTVLASRDLPPISEDAKKTFQEVVRSSDNDLNALLEVGVKPETLGFVFKYYLWQFQRSLASTQYKEIAQNEGVHGLSLVVEPNAEAIQKAAAEIASTLAESFSTLAGVRSGDVDKEALRQKSNAMTQTFYAIVGAAADKFKDQPVLNGVAAVRDEKGRQVAHKKLLVSRNELTRLRSTLDALHKKFQARTSKADRQDVAVILDDLKQVTASTTAGQQKFAAGVKLKDIISDLPLRTTALETTPGDLAVMPSDTFKQWLNKVESAIFRADELLSGKAEWLELSSVAQNDKFTFLHVSELP